MKKIIDEIITNVAELPDRNSPDDWPNAMLVTGQELKEIIEDALDGYVIVPAEQASQPQIPEAYRKLEHWARHLPTVVLENGELPYATELNELDDVLREIGH